jgi:hypothetical protein
MSILTAADFQTGTIKIASDQYTAADVLSYITMYEPVYLRKMFGKALYDLFAANLTGNPQVPADARFLAVFNAFAETIDEDLVVSDGIKLMLKGFIYYEFVRKQPFPNTINGNTRNVSEASENASSNSIALIEEVHNRAVFTFEAIRTKLSDDAETYPEYDDSSEVKRTFLGGMI